MLDQLIESLASLPSWGVVVAAFAITYTENILPPSPSDVLLVFIGTLVGIGTASYAITLASATIGSITGFYTMFTIGRIFGDRLMHSRFGKLFPLELLLRAEQWFQRWGYYIIVANRFLSGTRSVISLFAGMSHLEPVRTTILCGVSALVWNALLLWAGMELGQNWRIVEEYFHTYGIVFWTVLGIATAAIALRVFLRRRVNAPPGNQQESDKA
jgi:membrane protein DedA with SNARE-associated domain